MDKVGGFRVSRINGKKIVGPLNGCYAKKLGVNFRVGKLKGNTLLVIGSAIFITIFIKYIEHDNEQTKIRNELREEELKDMSIPPTLSDRMKDPSWSIEYWIMADKFDPDCKTANEYMDENILEKTVTRRGSSYTHNIFEYLHSCKNASKRALELVQPRAKKWCYYKARDKRFEELCNEWEQNGQRYLKQIEQSYDVTIKRFQSITNGYYNDRL